MIGCQGSREGHFRSQVLAGGEQKPSNMPDLSVLVKDMEVEIEIEMQSEVQAVGRETSLQSLREEGGEGGPFITVGGKQDPDLVFQKPL